MMSIPIRAPRPVPTITAVGVAKPSAHGHAMTSTVMANKNEKRNSPSTSVHSLGSAPADASENHVTHVTVAMTTMAGTNTALTLSAYAWIGALATCASSMSLTTFESMESAPTPVASTSTIPLRFTVPPMTPSPGDLDTGIDSPVIMDSSAAVLPHRTIPSAGKCAPGNTRSTSPRCNSAVSTSLSFSGPAVDTAAASD